MQVRIYKYATKSTIVDISSALNYHRKNKRNEEEYKGSIQFVIHQYTKEKLAFAYLPKSTAKMVMNTIISHHFHHIFPNGFTQYGGSLAKNIARILTIKYDSEQNKYVFGISEGIGQLTETGGIKMTQKQKSVIAYLPYDETLKIAHEIVDFIKQAEITAMMKGKPLYTHVPDYQQVQNA